MSAKLWEAASVNAFSTTLNGSTTDSDSTITLTTTANLVAPGVLVIDRQDANGNDTPSTREYISFTGISGSDLTGVSRGVGGSSAQAHSSGALIEEVLSITHWNELIDFLNVSHDADGKLVVSSTATLSIVRLYTHLNASGASVTGNFPIHPTWYYGDSLSSPASGIGSTVSIPQGGTMKFVAATLKNPVSGASLVLDINKNGVSIFTDTATRLAIPGGGTYASTASIGTTGFNAGDFLNVDIDNGGGNAQYITVVTRIE